MNVVMAEACSLILITLVLVAWFIVGKLFQIQTETSVLTSDERRLIICCFFCEFFLTSPHLEWSPVTGSFYSNQFLKFHLRVGTVT